jgi:hypothetical protein
MSNKAFLDSIIMDAINNNDSSDMLTFSATSPLMMQGPQSQLQNLLLPMMEEDNSFSFNSSSCLKIVIILVLIYLIYKCLQSKNIVVPNYNNVHNVHHDNTKSLESHENLSYNQTYY